nr:hypothetical protein Ade03nite_66500 [Actinoplanes derwentensis]
MPSEQVELFHPFVLGLETLFQLGGGRERRRPHGVDAGADRVDPGRLQQRRVQRLPVLLELLGQSGECRYEIVGRAGDGRPRWRGRAVVEFAVEVYEMGKLGDRDRAGAVRLDAEGDEPAQWSGGVRRTLAGWPHDGETVCPHVDGSARRDDRDARQFAGEPRGQTVGAVSGGSVDQEHQRAVEPGLVVPDRGGDLGRGERRLTEEHAVAGHGADHEVAVRMGPDRVEGREPGAGRGDQQAGRQPQRCDQADLQQLRGPRDRRLGLFPVRVGALLHRLFELGLDVFGSSSVLVSVAGELRPGHANPIVKSLVEPHRGLVAIQHRVTGEPQHGVPGTFVRAQGTVELVVVPGYVLRRRADLLEQRGGDPQPVPDPAFELPYAWITGRQCRFEPSADIVDRLLQGLG